ncbi:MAG: agmatine deiminase family protein [Pseudomonadota bacterium]
MLKIGMLALSAIGLAACSVGETAPSPPFEAEALSGELILLAAPPDGDTYYAERAEDIFAFHVGYARAILDAGDDIVVFSGADVFDDYVEALGRAHVAPIEMQDIWMRDFTLSNTAAPVMFRYTAEGQGGGQEGQTEADFVQERFAAVLEAAGIDFAETDLLNDGGNFVDDYAGNVVASRKFLRDNDLSEDEGRRAMRRATGARHVAFIEADEQGGLEHADGVVAFVAENTLVINAYPEDPTYAADLRADLEEGLPGVTLHEIVTPYDGRDIYDPRFGSACGLYTNMLVTPQRIYFPQFGIPEDREALASVRRWTDREVIPVNSEGVCTMGGGVRCMSLQMRGPAATALLAYLRGV